MHYAAKKGSEFSVACLIKEFKADIEAKDHQKRTPLYVAAEHGQKNVVKMLLEFGCSEKVKNINGQKALYWIIAKCPEVVNIGIIQYLLLTFKYYYLNKKASEILDKYIESNKYTRQDYYYLHNVEHEPLDDINKIPESKSIVNF